MHTLPFPPGTYMGFRSFEGPRIDTAQQVDSYTLCTKIYLLQVQLLGLLQASHKPTNLRLFADYC